MREIILNKLKEVEVQYGVRILLAVESGSRAWGFESPDSDYNVRFIYARRKTEYLKLEKTRDVIELPIDETLDINGWDIDKALRLLYHSNPSMFEWLSSPITYQKDDKFFEQCTQLMTDYFSLKKGVYHYLNMAKSNYREHLQGDYVKMKKYFYVLRPILACRWIVERQTPPPMCFRKLVATELPVALQGEVDKLLDRKMNAPEIKLIPRVDVINRYLEESFEELGGYLASLEEPAEKSWDALNHLFLATIGE